MSERVRGLINEELIAWTEGHNGETITIDELQLLPYLIDCSMNNNSIDPRKVTPDERVVLKKFKDKGWVNNDLAQKVQISKLGYEFFCGALFYGG